VDNFQGEEAKVIVISLVRSNDERKCGFLKTSNRINVLLSRARHGMYIIGNTHTARPVPMWDKVITILENDGNIGNTLALCCPRHKETPIEVSEPDDFSILSPEGGCNRKCISRLRCGYATRNRCIILFGAWSAAKGSKKAVITPVRSFTENPAIRNVKSRCRISPCLVGTFKQVWHATWHRLRKLFNAMSWLKLLCQIISIL